MNLNLKTLGIVRKIDDLGRVVVPMEIRKANGWVNGTPVEMFGDQEGGLYIRSYGRGYDKEIIIQELNKIVDYSGNQEMIDTARKAISFLRNEV
ncbi:AbrB/MazE/SpoVT family DNA-binding domain-containing protein [Bacillus infantis]|jgi:bifunctional DNA-binding transcriptional regulator/antitoxin component of YhaV-PrlF toxin-antitoxin module|uniref:AbrB/MazE/SpoVT family DNA-binding domain-containing protein n=1 Tax=Bacillus infantis TaxID=324767 RepID=UPI003CF62268